MTISLSFRRRLRAFWHGLASVVNLSGDMNASVSSPNESDMERIGGDFRRVGEDLRRAERRYESDWRTYRERRKEDEDEHEMVY